MLQWLAAESNQYIDAAFNNAMQSLYERTLSFVWNETFQAPKAQIVFSFLISLVPYSFQ